jgi:hypothetical protein
VREAQSVGEEATPADQIVFPRVDPQLKKTIDANPDRGTNIDLAPLANQ